MSALQVKYDIQLFRKHHRFSGLLFCFGIRMCACMLSCVRLFATLWDWDLPDPGIEAASLESPALQANFLLLSYRGSPVGIWDPYNK